VKLIPVLGAALVVGALVPPPAIAHTEPLAVHHHFFHHHPSHQAVHHSYLAHAPTMAPRHVSAAVAPALRTGPFGLAFPHIAPYPNGKGDEDGLSEDPDDCNKGCVDGNGAD
jgi:hypothetical protein